MVNKIGEDTNIEENKIDRMVYELYGLTEEIQLRISNYELRKNSRAKMCHTL